MLDLDKSEWNFENSIKTDGNKQKINNIISITRHRIQIKLK